MQLYDFPADSEETNLFKDELTDQKVHKHLSDEHDEITEADIANIRTDALFLGEQPTEAAAVAEKSDASNELPLKDNSDPEVETPWNILD